MPGPRRRISRSPLAFCAVVAGLWTLPWAALSVVQFDPRLAPWLFSSGRLSWGLPLYGLDWVLAPLLLLAAVDPVRHDRGLWWHTGWLAAIVVGSAFQVAAPLYGWLLDTDPATPAPYRWPALPCGAGFVLLAVVMAVLLAGSPRRGRAGTAQAESPSR